MAKHHYLVYTEPSGEWERVSPMVFITLAQKVPKVKPKQPPFPFLLNLSGDLAPEPVHVIAYMGTDQFDVEKLAHLALEQVKQRME